MSRHAHVSLGAGREFDIVRSLLRRWGSVAHGLGDDAAVLDLPPGERLVVSTDSSVENVHFRREWLSPREIGYRAATAALSDLAAMGARPLAMVLALATTDTWLHDIDALADGIGDASSEHACPIVGGDLTRAGALSLTFTVLGGAITPTRRSAVLPDDLIYVTGSLGAPLLALRSLERGDAPQAEHRARFAHPGARVREGLWLAGQGGHAMIDVSDGLASELGHLAAASGVKIAIEAHRVPLAPGCTVQDALRSGEEYELVIASSVALDTEEFERRFALRLSEIGRAHAAVGADEGVLVDGRRVDLRLGHDHFMT